MRPLLIATIFLVGCLREVFSPTPPTLTDARRVAGAVTHPQAAGAPHSLDEVADVLREDRVGEYPAAYLLTLQTPTERKAIVLGAELQVAWSEHESLMADVIGREFNLTSGPTRKEIEPMLLDLRKSSQQHLERGLELAKVAVAVGPGDDAGFRVLARAALNARDWFLFDENMSELDLFRAPADVLYLLGREQIERYGKHASAVHLLRASLERDPGYLPAQAELVRIRPASFSEYRRLKIVASDHPLVTVIGPILERRRAVWNEQEERLDRAEEVALGARGP